MNANAYCSAAEADQCHENHGNPTTWAALDQAQKEQAIRTATQHIDLLYNWKWRRNTIVEPGSVLSSLKGQTLVPLMGQDYGSDFCN